LVARISTLLPVAALLLATCLLILSIGLDESGVARFMAAAYCGALLLQWPLGWLSDRVDRRRVILLNTFGTLVVSLAIVLALNSHHGPIFTLFSFFFGTLGLTLYSVCMESGLPAGRH
jgi:MFS family permease